MKKIALSLLLVMLITLVISCGETGGGSDTVTETTAADQSGETTIEETQPLTDGLPDVDMEGFTLRIMHSSATALSWLKTTLDVDQQTGDLIDDEIFIRNSQIKERFNAGIEIGEGAHFNDVIMTLSTSVLAGDDAHDVYMLYNITIVDNISYMADWNNVEHLNLDAQWWNPDASGVFNIGGKQYALAGNFSLNVHSTIYGFAFNKAMYENLGIKEDLYQLANDGKWTVDVLYATAKNAISDVNGDGNFDQNDIFGMHNAVKHTYNTILLGSGVKYTSKDADGFPVFSLVDDEGAINKIMHIIELAMSDKFLYVAAGDVHDGSVPENFFKNGHALYAPVSLNIIHELREMEDDIGILPAPKYDEQQSQYYAPAYGAELSILPLSYSSDRIENIGILLEALSFYSDQNILPVYKEKMLKTKLSRDVESEGMLDIIFNSVIFEFGINAWQDNLSTPLMTNVFFNLNTNLISTLDTIKPVLEGKAEALKTYIQGLD
jgi:hypothetical protein